MIEKKIRWFQITGCPRSGTTFVQQTLNTHKEVVCLHEYGLVRLSEAFGSIFPQKLHGNRNLPTLPSINQSRAVAMAERRALVLAKNHSLRPFPSCDAHRSTLEQRFFEIVGGKQNPVLLGDKTPNLRVAELLRLKTLYPEILFIHVFRRPRDVIASSLARAEAMQRGEDLWHLTTFSDALHEWQQNMMTFVEMRKVKGISQLFLKYEWFEADYGSVLSKLSEFMSVPNEFQNLFFRVEPENHRLIEAVEAKLAYTHLKSLDKTWIDVNIDYLAASDFF